MPKQKPQYLLSAFLHDLSEAEYRDAEADRLLTDVKAVGKPRKGTREWSLWMQAIQMQGESHVLRNEINEQLGVPGMRTLCLAAGSELDAKAVRTLCARAALQAGKTLDDLSAMLLTEVVDLLAAGSTEPTAKASKSEGKAGAGSMPKADMPLNVGTALTALKPADRKAYLAFRFAERHNIRTMQYREAWNWLREKGTERSQEEIDRDQDLPAELLDYRVPSLETFKRYLVRALAQLGEGKNARRAGRPHGRSVVDHKRI